MINVVAMKVLDAKIIDGEGEGGRTCSMGPQTWGVGGRSIPKRSKMSVGTIERTEIEMPVI